MNETRYGSRLGQWRLHHKQSLKEACQELLKKPLASLMTLVVIAIAVALPSGLFVGLQNLQAITKNWNHQASISLYLKKGAPEFEVNTLMSEMKKNTAVETVRYISPDEGLADFQRITQVGNALEQLKQNPLPGVIVVTPTKHFESPEKLKLLLSQYQSSSAVQSAQMDLAWVHRLYYIVSLGKRVTYTLASLFCLGVLLIIGNTIRLTIEHHYEEMTILKLIGATDAFIRRPILYQGLLYGLLGGLLAWAVVGAGMLWLEFPAQELASSYSKTMILNGLSFFSGITMVIVSMCLGLLGAAFAAHRKLKALS